MPALPLIPNVLKAQVLWNDSSDLDVSSTHYFRYSGTPPNGANAANFATVISNAFAADESLWHPDTLLVGAKVTDLSSSSGGQGSATANVPGTSSGSPLAGGTAAVANYAIDRRYRGGKPRNYFPWGTSSSLTSRQAWSPAFTSDMVSLLLSTYQAIIGTVEGGTTLTAHVNVSYYDGFTVVTSPTTGRARNVSKLRTTPVVDDIVGLSALSRPASQRRRNRN